MARRTVEPQDTHVTRGRSYELGVVRLIEDDPALVEAVIREGVAEVRELAGWDADRWIRVIERACDAAPQGAAAEYAAKPTTVTIPRSSPAARR